MTRDAGVGRWEWHADSDTLTWDDELAAIVGASAPGSAGCEAAIARFVHPDDQVIARTHTADQISQRGTAQFECRVVLPDGTVRWVETRASLRTTPDGSITGASGVTFDITERKLRECEQAGIQERLALLAEVTTTLAGSLNVEEVLEQLANIVVPRLCDAVLLDCIDDEGMPGAALIRAHDPEVARLLERAETLSPRRYNLQTAAGRAFATGEPALVPDVTEHYLRTRLTPAEAAECFLKARISSAVVTPLSAAGGVVGVMSMYATGSSHRYGDEDADLAIEIGRRAGLALNNARLYSVERRVAETLQRALLPTLPQVAGLDLAARYLPAGGPAQEVGGDWYDVFPTGNGAVGITVGDVGGHDVRAAAAMAHTRSALRAYACRGERPASVLELLSEFVQQFEIAEFVTVGYGQLTRSGDSSGWALRWASCGHPPPLLVTADNRATFIEVDPAPPLGAPGLGAPMEVELALAPGDTLICYSDGLVETRDSDLTDGLAELATAAVNHPEDAADRVCDAVVAELTPRLGADDVALLVIRATG